MKRLLLALPFALSLFSLLLGSPTLIQAQAAGGAEVEAPAAADADPAASRATEFRAVRGAEAEQVPGGTLMVVAYGLVWAFLMLFVVRMALLHRRVTSDLRTLESLIHGSGSAREPSSKS